MLNQLKFLCTCTSGVAQVFDAAGPSHLQTEALQVGQASAPPLPGSMRSMLIRHVGEFCCSLPGYKSTIF